MSEAKKNSSKTPSSPFLNGVFVGALVGAGALYLLGTKEGRKSRQKILEKSKKALKALQKVVEEIEEKKDDLVAKTEEVQKDIKKESSGISKFLPKLRVNRFFKKGKELK